MTFRKLPTGMQDILPPECRILNQIKERLAFLFEHSGYEPVLSAAVDYYDTYSQIESALPEERMFKFTDGDGKLLVLRPDATLSISRIAATKLGRERARLYYFADKWDAQNAGGLKSREIFQAGVERLGESGAFSDAQTIAFAVDCARAVGICDLIVEVGHVGYFKGILHDSGLTAAPAEEVRRHINAKDGLNAERVLSSAGAGRSTLDAVRALPALFGGREVFDRAEALTESKEARAAIAHLREVERILTDMGYEKSVCFDLGTVKRLSYYSGVVFSGFVRELGVPVLSGGRYDTLADGFGKHIPAVGFAMGLKRVLVALERQGNLPSAPVLDAAVGCERGAEREAYALSAKLAAEGVRAVLAAEYGKDALAAIAAKQHYFVTKKGVQKT